MRSGVRTVSIRRNSSAISSGLIRLSIAHARIASAVLPQFQSQTARQTALPAAAASGPRQAQLLRDADRPQPPSLQILLTAHIVNHAAPNRVEGTGH